METLLFILVVLILIIQCIINARLGRLDETVRLIKQMLMKAPVEPERSKAALPARATPPAPSPYVVTEPSVTPPASTPQPAPEPVYQMPPYPQPAAPQPFQRPAAAATASMPKSQAAPLSEMLSWKHFSGNFEQWVGSRAALVAGLITTLIGVGLFLKYLYDQSFMGPLGRVTLISISGLACVAIGEITRRRNFGLVARGLTALGFGILYAAIFFASQLYHLMGSTPALIIASLLTALAMSYAVGLNDALAAFVALLGGYLAPAILEQTGAGSTLFIYCTILTLGALACACYRSWRVIHWQSFIGTFILYGMWYDHTEGIAEGSTVWLTQATIWLSVFFLIFLVMPVLRVIIFKDRSGWSDAALLLMNALVSLGYYSILLLDDHRRLEALICALMAVIHLALLALVRRRQTTDSPLAAALLALGVSQAALAAPFYFQLGSTLMLWALQATILLLIARRYRNKLCEALAMILAMITLVALPVTIEQRIANAALVFNRSFLSALSVCAAFYLMHWIYRRFGSGWKEQASQLLWLCYGVAWVLLQASAMTECYHYFLYTNTITPENRLLCYQAFRLIWAIGLLTLALVPVRQRTSFGPLLTVAAATLAGLASMVQYPMLYGPALWHAANSVKAPALIFLNPMFLAALGLLAAMLACGWLVWRQRESVDSSPLALRLVMAVIVGLWLLLTQEIYFFWNLTGLNPGQADRCGFLAQMYISIMWAVYGGLLLAAGFWRSFRPARYAGLALLVLTLLKVFLRDMSHLAQVYRIAGVVVLGVILLIVAFLYQHARNRGWFTAADKPNP